MRIMNVTFGFLLLIKRKAHPLGDGAVADGKGRTLVLRCARYVPLRCGSLAFLICPTYAFRRFTQAKEILSGMGYDFTNKDVRCIHMEDVCSVTLGKGAGDKLA